MTNGHDNLKDLAKLAGVDKDPAIAAMVDSPLLSGPRREKLAKFLRSLVAQRCPRPHAFLPAPTPEQAAAGTIPLGRVITGLGPQYVYRLRPDEAATGTLICGPTGAGKTMLLARLALEFHRQGYAMWVFDSEGDLTSLLVRASPDFLVVDYRQFRQEIFQPDPRMQLEWIEFISKVIASWSDPLMAGDGMRCMSREVLIALRDRNAPLTPHQFLEELLRRKHRMSSREGNFFDSLRNRFEGMILPVLGQTYAGGHHDLLAMLHRSLIWRLQGLSVDTLAFFTTEMLLPVSLLQHPQPGGKLENLQILDEFARYQGGDSRPRLGAGEPFLVDYIRTARKRSLGVLPAVQTPQLLPKAILSDMNTMITFRPVDGSYLDCVSQAMNLNREQEIELMELPDREPRHVVVRCPAISNPFLVELPQHEMEWATPEEIAQRVQLTKAWLDGIYQPPARPQPPSVDDAKPGPLFAPRDHPLSKALLDYFVACAQDWSMSVTARDKKHGVSTGVGNRYRKQLRDEGLILAHQIQNGRRGGQLQVTEITEEGYGLLDRYEVRVHRPPGRGSFEHRIWQQVVHSWAIARGYPSRVEYEISGHPADVGTVWQEKQVAFEIVVEGIEKELDNLAKDVERGWDEVTFCAVKQETLDQLKERILAVFGSDLISQGRVGFGGSTSSWKPPPPAVTARRPPAKDRRAHDYGCTHQRELHWTRQAGRCGHRSKQHIKRPRRRRMQTRMNQAQPKGVTGTREWASENVNCCRGCSHDCLYCYARSMALRFKRTSPSGWRDELVLERELCKKRRRVAGTVMFPTTHDITPGNLPACQTVLKNLLDARNRVLIVSKPHLACIQSLCAGLTQWNRQILFRFTINVMDEGLRQFWEPGAPAFCERLASLRWAHEAGFETSVSAEPLLEPWNVQALVDTVRPFVSHSIWIGKANQLRQRTSWKLQPDHPEIVRLLAWQTDEKVRETYEVLNRDPLIRWKDSYKSVIGIDPPQEPGLDV